MRLDRLTASHVRRAVQTYMNRAWPTGEQGQPRFDVEQLDESETLTEILAFFDKPKAGHNPGTC